MSQSGPGPRICTAIGAYRGAQAHILIRKNLFLGHGSGPASCRSVRYASQRHGTPGGFLSWWLVGVPNPVTNHPRGVAGSSLILYITTCSSIVLLLFLLSLPPSNLITRCIITPVQSNCLFCQHSFTAITKSTNTPKPSICNTHSLPLPSWPSLAWQMLRSQLVPPLVSLMPWLHQPAVVQLMSHANARRPTRLPSLPPPHLASSLLAVTKPSVCPPSKHLQTQLYNIKNTY